MYIIQLLDRFDLDDDPFIDNEVSIISTYFFFSIDDFEFFFFNDLPIVQL